MASGTGIPVPAPMDMKGDLTQNWDFFRESWDNYEIATELREKSLEVRVATLLAVIGKHALRIYRHLPTTEGEGRSPKAIMDKLEAHFKPARK